MREESLKTRKQRGDVDDQDAVTQALKVPARDIYGLTPALVKLIIAILSVNALIGIASYSWQIFVGVKSLAWAPAIAFWVFDFVLMYALAKRKHWMRLGTIVRGLSGAAVLLILGVMNTSFFDPISQIIIFAGVIIMLTGKIEESQNRLLGWAVILFIGYVGYYNLDALFFRQKVVRQFDTGGDRVYASQKFRFNMAIPGQWIVIQKRDFNKVDKSFIKSGAEIAMVTLDEKGSCLVIPEDTENLAYGYDTEYKLDMRKRAFLDTVSKIEGVQHVSQRDNFLLGNGGFEIRWKAYRDDGNQYSHCLFYGMFDNDLAIQMVTWSQDLDAEEIFNQVRKILQSVELP